MAFVSVGFGFLLLLFGAESLVRGAVSLAGRLGISKLLIGLTVTALTVQSGAVRLSRAIAGHWGT